MNRDKLVGLILKAYRWGRDNGSNRSDKNFNDLLQTSEIKSELDQFITGELGSKGLNMLPIELKSVKELKRGDIFLWRSAMTGRYEIHMFHSDAGYGVKTFTNYNEKDGSSALVNWSGVCGILVGND